jgi:Flp pilus assembly CpaF family ATPase
MKQIDLHSMRNTIVFGKPSAGKTTALPLTVNIKSTRIILIMDTKELCMTANINSSICKVVQDA